MTTYYDLTINEFFDMVYEFWKSGGNSYLRDKAKSASGKGEHIREGTIYTVFWSLLQLANKEKIDYAVKTNNIDMPGTIFYRMIHDGCKVQISDIHQKRPNTPTDFFSSASADTFQGAFENKVDGNTKIKEALEEIEEHIESKKGVEKRKQFNAAQRRMFEETNVGDEKVSTHNYKAYMQEIEAAIDNGAKQIILTGAPGTGKTKMAKEVAEEIVRDRIEEATKENKLVDDYIEFVQFHPSYDYTDFVEGLRPVEVKLEVKSQSTEEVKSEVKSQPTEGAQKEAEHQSIAKSEIVFKRVDGIFKRFCRKVVEKNKEHEENEQIEHFFLIDEINRADLSKVFGELMYCLESDKRGEKNSVKTPYHNLNIHFPDDPDKTNDVFKDGFYIPKNVYIIGTMNDIDRSVESMDFALRRRFMFMEIAVTKPLLEGAFKNIFSCWNDDKPEELAGRVMKMNEVMKAPAYKDFGLNEQYYISQGQFANLPNNTPKDSIDKLLKEVWKWRIKPLLREYVRGEDPELVNRFLEDCENALMTSPKKYQSDSTI